MSPIAKSSTFAVAAFFLLATGTTAVAQDAVRLAMDAFDTEAQIEVRNMAPAQAEAVIREALTEIHTVQRLLSREPSDLRGIAYIQANAGESVSVDPRVTEVLARDLQYCLWSSGAISPLGGGIERLWRLREQTGEGPHPRDLQTEVQRAECDRLELIAGPPPTVKLTPGSELSMLAVEKGFAIDKAIELLLRRGVTNAFVEIGHVVRGIGSGPDGNGWLVAVPGHPKTRNPLDHFWLVNQSLAVVRKGGETRVNHRKGVPSTGVVQVAAVSELAVDTEVLAHTLFVTGSPEGQRLLGFLTPKPAVFWLLGNGVGKPLESQYHWSTLSRPRRSSY